MVRANPYKAAFITACAMALAVACGDGGGDGEGSGGRDGSGDSDGWGGEAQGGSGGGMGTVTYAALESVAKLIYDDLDKTEGEPDGNDAAHLDHLPSHIAGALEGLGFPFLAEVELDDDEFSEEAEALLDAGVPFATTTSVYQLARAYDGGMLVDVAGYFEGLEEQEVTTLLGDALSLHDWVGSQMYTVGLTGASQPDVPIDASWISASFIWALGQERARRFGDEEELDPIWGDGRLDPLQFTLLNYIIFSAPAAQARRLGQDFAPRPQYTPQILEKIVKPVIKDIIKERIKDQAKDAVTDILQDILEVPLDPVEGVQVSICSSLLLYGHKVYLENDPATVYHKNSGSPNETTVDLLLNFEDDYTNNTKGQVAAFLTECDLPPKGFVPGKPVKEWSVAGGISGHGDYTEKDTVTDELGTARATWETIEDNIQPSCRPDDIEPRAVVGETTAKVSGLLPGWSTLEAIVTTLRSSTGAEGHASLAVHYKRQKVDRNCHYPD